MSLNKIILFTSFFIFLACSERTKLKMNNAPKLKKYCKNCYSDTTSITKEKFVEYVSSVFYSDTIRWKGTPLDSLRIESGIVNYFPFDSVEEKSLRKIGLTIDTSAIKDFAMFKFNESGFLKTAQVYRFGDLKDILLTVSYNNDTIMSKIDIHSPTVYYGKVKPKESFIFKSNGTILKITNNNLKESLIE